MATVSATEIAGFTDPTQVSKALFYISRRYIIRDVGFPASNGSSGGSTVFYTMRAVQNGTTTVYWESASVPDNAGTGPNAPGGTLTDIGIQSIDIRG